MDVKLRDYKDEGCIRFIASFVETPFAGYKHERLFRLLDIKEIAAVSHNPFTALKMLKDKVAKYMEQLELEHTELTYDLAVSIDKAINKLENTKALSLDISKSVNDTSVAIHVEFPGQFSIYNPKTRKITEVPFNPINDIIGHGNCEIEAIDNLVEMVNKYEEVISDYASKVREVCEAVKKTESTEDCN